jgi:hypothetical protein
MITGLEPVIRFDGIFVVIYLGSVLPNLISLWQISDWPIPRRINELDQDRDLAIYIKELKELHKQ